MSRDDLQISLVLNGGVSLAVWMSGAVLELDRARCADPGARGESPLERVVGAMLGLARRRIVIDLIAGTSAGGINGALLAAAIANGRRLERERLLDTWLGVGDVARLLRPTRAETPPPPSLLKGDDCLRPALGQTVQEILERGERAGDGTPTNVSLILTATDLEGIPRRIGGPDGASYREHRAHLRFTEPPRKDWAPLTPGRGRGAAEVAADLALAGRTSASFPAAFEASRFEARKWMRTAEGGAVTDAPVESPTREAIDGGVLDNSPFVPMLDQIERSPTGADLDRTFVFVTPYDDEPATLRPPARGSLARGPGALDAVGWTAALKGELAGLANLTRFSAQTERYREARRVGVMRDLFACAGRDELTAAAGAMLPAYRAMRWRSALGARDAGLAEIPASTRWLPASLDGSREPWSWGSAPVRRTGAFAADVIADAQSELPARTPGDRALRARLLDAEGRVRAALTDLSAAELRRTGAFEDDPGSTGRPEEVATAMNDSWSDEARRERTALFEEIAGALVASREALGTAPGLDGPDREGALRALGVPAGATLDELGELLLAAEVVLQTGDRGASTGADIRPRVRLVTLRGGTADPERPQLRVGNAFGTGPVRTKDALLGMSLAHFGGFLFSSWRANDWMFGRLHAAAEIPRMLLGEARLCQIGSASADPERDAAAGALAGALTDGLDDEAAAALRGVLTYGLDDEAAPALPRMLADEPLADAVAAIVREALDPAEPARRGRAVELLQAAATWRMQVEILREELPTVRTEIAEDREKGARMPLTVSERGLGPVRLGRSNSRWVAILGEAGPDPLPAGAALAAFEEYNLPRVGGLRRQWVSAPMVALLGRLVFVARAALGRPVQATTPRSPLLHAGRPARAGLRLVRVWASVPVWVAGGRTMWRAAIPAAARSFLATALVAYLLALPGADATTLLGCVAGTMVGLPWLAGLAGALFSSTSAFPGRLIRAVVPLAAAVGGVLAGIAARRTWGIDDPVAGVVLLVAWLAAMAGLGWLEDEVGLDAAPPRAPAPEA